MKFIPRFAASGCLLALTLTACLAGQKSVRAQAATSPTNPQKTVPTPPAKMPGPGGAAPGTAPAGDRVPEAFTLGPEDVIEVTVRDHSDLSSTLTILPDGKIVFPTVGEMQAGGKTLRGLAADIQTELETTLNDIHVTVTLKEVHSRRVRIVGVVRQPGSFDLKRDWRLFDAVTAAGGLGTKPEQVTARMIRGGQMMPINLADALRSPLSSANILLERDDLLLLDEVVVPRRQVQIIGQVARPSVYDLEPDTTLLQALALAGNPTEKAALSRAYVLRNGEQIPINLYAFLVEGKADDSVTKFHMQSGDVLFVPMREARFGVQGAVGRPAYYAYPEKGSITVLDALNEAGVGNGDLSRAGIIRMAGGKYTVIPVNIDQMLKKGDLSKNVVLQPNDMLYVPAKGRHGFGLQDVLAPFTVLRLFGLGF